MRRLIIKFLIAAILAILGILAIIAAIIWFITAAHALPGLLGPVHHGSGALGRRTSNGAWSLVLGIVLLALSYLVTRIGRHRHRHGHGHDRDRGHDRHHGHDRDRESRHDRHAHGTSVDEQGRLIDLQGRLVDEEGQAIPQPRVASETETRRPSRASTGLRRRLS